MVGIVWSGKDETRHRDLQRRPAAGSRAVARLPYSVIVATCRRGRGRQVEDFDVMWRIEGVPIVLGRFRSAATSRLPTPLAYTRSLPTHLSMHASIAMRIPSCLEFDVRQRLASIAARLQTELFCNGVLVTLLMVVRPTNSSLATVAQQTIRSRDGLFDTDCFASTTTTEPFGFKENTSCLH